MKKSLHKTLLFLAAAGIATLTVHQFTTDSLAGYKEARLNRKAAKQARIQGYKDYEKRIRGMIVPTENGTEFEDRNAVTYPDFHKVREFEKAFANRRMMRSTATWTERGPGNFSGRVTSIAVDPNNINNIYVGTAGGGVFKTSNKGQDWTAVTENLPNLTITRVAMSKNNSSVIYAGTGDTFANDGSGDGIYKSTDSGASWTRLASTENDNFKYVSNIVVDQTNENNLTVATTKGVFYSTNGGSTFSNSSLTNIDVTDIAAKVGDFNTQYAVSYTSDGNGGATASGIYRSTNGGQTWSQASNLGISRKRMTLAVAESNTAVAYVLAEGTDGKGYFYKTSNSGSSWSELSQSGTFKNVFQTHGENQTGGQGWYDQSLTVNALNSNEVYVGGIDLYRATATTSSISLTRITHGYSWSPDAGSTPLVHVDQHAAVSVKTGTNSYEMFFGNDGGFWSTTNSGNSFTNLTNGLRNVQFYSAQKHPSLYKFVAGAQDNGTFISSLNPGTTSDWGSEKIGGDGFGVVWHQGNANYVIGGSQNGGLRKSTNGGSSFGSMSTPWSSAPFVNKIGHSTANNERIVYSGANNQGGRIYVSNNFGTSWSTKTPPRSAYTGSMASNVISPVDANIIWVADAIGKLSNGTNLGVFRSTNGGTSFTETTVPTEFQSGAWYAGGFAAHPTQSNTGYLLMSIPGKPHITRTTDGGQTWSSLTNNNGFPDVATYCLAVNPNDLNEIWVGTEIGLFMSNDNGATWSYASNGLPAVMVREITFTGNTVVVATFGRGLFTAELGAAPIVLNAPTGVASSNVTTSAVTVSWTDNNTQEDGYKVERALGNGSFAEVASVNGTSFTNTGLASSTTYRFRVRAYKGTTMSDYSSIVSVTTQTEVVTVTAPSSLAMVSKSENSVAMSWADNSNNEDGFKIERSTGGSYTQIATVSAGVTSYSNTGLTANTSYSYRVLAYKGAVNSGYSNVLSVTTDPEPPVDTDYEPNNSFAQAASIEVNQLISSFIATNGDEDYFKITIPSAGKLKVTLANFPGDYDVFLYNASQTELGKGYTTNDPEIVDYDATAAGTFYIRVDGYQSAYSATDDYELTVTYTETSTNTPQWFYVNQTIESAHNYSNYTDQTKSYSQAGAQKVAVHFKRFETESNYDFVYIYDKNGTEIAKYHGTKSAFWVTVDGDKIDIRLKSDYSVVKWGYEIDQVGYYANSQLNSRGRELVFGEENDTPVDGSLTHISNDFKTDAVDALATKESVFELPTNYSLKGNYPNPFNPVTTIRFDVPERSHVQVQVLNSLGQVVKTLQNGLMDAGKDLELVWDATNDYGNNVASGIYFYRMVAGKHIEVKKMTLLK